MNPYDPFVVLTAVAALGFSAFLASLIPALKGQPHFADGSFARGVRQ